MIENLSSKIDTLSGKAPATTVSETNETNPENMASTSRSTELNELTQVGGHYIGSFCFSLVTSLENIKGNSIGTDFRINKNFLTHFDCERRCKLTVFFVTQNRKMVICQQECMTCLPTRMHNNVNNVCY